MANFRPDPTLYIIMRNDLDSMVPGKACAQASHATNLFEAAASADNNLMYDEYKLWKESAGGFGTCLVLGASGGQIEYLTKCGRYNNGINIISGKVVDPTYPISDGAVTWTVSATTCMYVFLPGGSAGLGSLPTEFTNVFDTLELY